jgi:hypothetical protein
MKWNDFFVNILCDLDICFIALGSRVLFDFSLKAKGQ